MNLSEVIREHKQRHGSFKVFPFAAESIRQARQSPHSHPHRQIHSFDMRRADQIAVGVADPRFNDYPLQLPRRVARRAFRHARVNLDHLTIVNPRPKAQTNRVRVSGHSVSRQLKVSRRGFVQLLNKNLSILPIPAAQMPSQDQLAIAFESKERVGIALALVVRVALAGLFAKDKAPEFVSLYVCDWHLAHALLQQLLALVASNLENAEHGPDSHVAQAGRAANATAFAQAVQNAVQLRIWQVDSLNGFARPGRERALTVTAFESGSLVAAKVAVQVGIASAFVGTFHGITKSFLTRITVGNTMRVDGLAGIYGAGQVKSWGSASNTSPDSLFELAAATVGFEPTSPEGLADLQSAPIDLSGTSPSVRLQISLRLLLHFRFQFRLICQTLSCVRDRLVRLINPHLQTLHVLLPCRPSPFVGSFAAAARPRDCLASRYKPLHNCMYACQSVLLNAKVITRTLKPISNLNSGASSPGSLQGVATSISDTNRRQRGQRAEIDILILFHQGFNAKASLFQLGVASLKHLALLFHLGQLSQNRFVSLLVIRIHSGKESIHV